MKSITELAALATAQWSPWTASGWFRNKPATEESVALIESELGIIIPSDFVDLSRLAHNYGVHFGSIGDDYTSPNHLLRLNAGIHRDEDSSRGLSSRWVLIDHGHDGDCSCFDITLGEGGEYPISYIDLDLPEKPLLIAISFRQYLEKILRIQ